MNMLVCCMMSIQRRVFDYLVAGLYESDDYSESLSKLAAEYPFVWVETLLANFSVLNQADDSKKWIKLLLQISANVDDIEIVDLCVTSIHSVNVNIRKASVCALTQIGSQIALSPLLVSLELFTVNLEVFAVLGAFAGPLSPQILEFLLGLFTRDPELVMSQYLGAICDCVSVLISESSIDPALLVTAWELISPLCWSRSLIASKTFLFEVIKATCCLCVRVPALEPAAVHSVQTALMRTSVHALTRTQLVLTIEAIHELLKGGKLFHCDETRNIFIPILIDLGITTQIATHAANALNTPAHDEPPSVCTCMLSLWGDMTEDGVAFVLERVVSKKLSVADRTVCLVYLCASSNLGDSVCRVLEILIKQSSAPVESLATHFLLRLIERVGPHSGIVAEFVVDLVPLKAAVSALTSLHADDQIVGKLLQFPQSGASELFSCLREKIVSESAAGSLMAFALVTGCVSDFGRLTALLLPGVNVGPSNVNDKPHFLRSIVLPASPLQFMESMARALLLQVGGIPFFEICIDFLPNATGEEIYLSAISNQTDYMAMGACLGQFAHTKFPEYLRIISRLKPPKNAGFFRNLFANQNTINEQIRKFNIARISLGESAKKSVRFASEIAPIYQSHYLDPCVETLLHGGEDSSVFCTLTALKNLYSVPGTGLPTPPSLLNAILPLCTTSAMCEPALLALAAVISGAQSLSAVHFDQAVQFSLSALTRGVDSFATIDTQQYTLRLEAVSDCIAAAMKHVASPYLGLSRLAQSVQLSGINGPLPVLRILVLQMYSRVVHLVHTGTTDGAITAELLETLLVLVPRTRDPVTEELAMHTIERFVPVCGSFTQFFVGVSTNLLPLFVQLCIQLSSDSCHESAVFILHILNSVLAVRGSEIPSNQSAQLISRMFAHSEKHSVAIGPNIQECIHTLSLAHLNSTLAELISHPVGPTQVAVIESLVRVPRMCVGFINYMSDLINNSSSQQTAAAEALTIAFRVKEVREFASKYSAVICGTILLYERNSQKNSTDCALWDAFIVCIGSPTTFNDHLDMYMNSQTGQNLTDLANFFVPFMLRTGREQQRKIAAQCLSRISATVPLISVRDAFLTVLSSNDPSLGNVCLEGLRNLTSIFTEETLKQIFPHCAVYTEKCLQIIHAVNAWESTLLDNVSTFIHAYECEPIIYTVISQMCKMASTDFKKLVDTRIWVEIKIRNAPCLSDVEAVATRDLKLTVNDFDTVIRPYFATTPGGGPTRAAIQIANENPDCRNRILLIVLAAVNRQSQNKSRDQMIESLGDIVCM